MKIYIDSDYKCHVSQGEGMTEIEASFFDNKASEFIEGYRFVPAGETWTRSDGVQFRGEMIAPWKPSAELGAAQRAYEQNLIAQYETALSAVEQALEVQT